jgi:hypothetical protein
LKPFLVLVLLTFAAISTSVGADERRDITATVDQFCGWTGLKRVSEIRDIGHWKTRHQSGGNAKFDLLVDGRRKQYSLIFFWERGRVNIYAIEPENYDWHGHGIGFDTLKDPKTRRWAVAAVKRVNQHLGWKFAFGPEIQKIGRDVLVTYETVSREEQKRTGYSYVDPYISFLISPKGTVFAAFMQS